MVYQNHNFVAMLRAIVDCPTQTDVRIELADFLDENGHGDWAAFIRNQIEASNYLLQELERLKNLDNPDRDPTQKTDSWEKKKQCDRLVSEC